ncbi:MAG: type II secretion system protein [Acidimicrobiia bacterium]
MLQAAIQRLRNRKNDEEQGFTLIELMVVVLIIAILIAFAIPTFLGARRRAQDRSAQSSDRNTLSAADTIYSDNQTYTDVDAAALGAEEPSITFKAGNAASTGPKDVSVDAADADNLYIVALSDSGTCFGIWSNKAVGGGGVQFTEVDGGTCDADSAQVAANVNWQSEF